MKTIYCISGLGADERAFSRLQITGYNLHVIAWLRPMPKESITQYATRMSESIVINEPVILMGLSFGGIICTEIAKQLNVKKIIIISSVKQKIELPKWMKLAGFLRINKIVPVRQSFKITEPIQNKILGVNTKEEKMMINELRRNADKIYTKWAVNQVINWKNNWLHPAIFHIHGDKDYMFPIKTIKANYIVKNGGHFMIMNRAEEVSQHINHALKQ
jgi:pimeloyl-ACP methyl ester carboxylesterase